MRSKNLFQGLQGALDNFGNKSVMLEMLPPRRSKLQIVVVAPPVWWFIDNTFDAQHCQAVLQLSNDISSGQTSVTTCNLLRFDLLRFDLLCFLCVCVLILKKN